MDELYKNLVKLKPKDNVPFKCIGCGECCKHVKEQVPVETLDAFRITRYLMEQMNVQEMITGETTRTLTLPYTARRNGVYELRHNLQMGLDNSGARTWMFTDLRTDRPKDFEFDILKQKISDKETES